MRDYHRRFVGITALVSAIVLALSGVSSADLIEPNLPERHEVKRRPRTEVAPPVGLTNPELPNRRGVDVEYLKIHAAGKVAEQFDSNVFLSDSDTESDFITILAPSVGVEKKFGDSLFSADYEIAQHLFGTWHSQNHLDHNLRGLLETQWTDYKITLSDNFRIFTDRASNEDSLRLKEDTNNFKAGASAQFEQFGFDAGYIQKLQVYDSNDLYIGSLTYNEKSYMDQSVYGTISYRVWPKTYLILENDLGYINYYKTSELPDSYYIDSLVGLRGEWTSKITLNLRAGFRYQHYDNSDVVAHKPYVGGIIRGGLEYNPTEDDKVKLDLERTDIESTYSTNNYYTLNLAGLDYKHKFSEKVSGGLFGVYQLHQYPSQTTENGVTAKRYDNLVNAGASLRYDMRKWMSAELKYEYRFKASKFDVFDFNDNLVTLRGTVGF